MAQPDFNIANQVPANLRADLNNAFSAIATNSSGASAPSTTFANQWWYDTTNNLLKIRNEADTAWITVGELDQTSGVWKPYVNGKQIADFLDEDDMASDSATAVPSQQSVKAYVDGKALGGGQTYQDVTASRAASTAYQNTTGRTIEVKVITGSATLNHELQWSDDGVTYVTVSRSGSGSNLMISTNTAKIPNGHYYKYIGNIASWLELR